MDMDKIVNINGKLTCVLFEHIKQEGAQANRGINYFIILKI